MQQNPDYTLTAVITPNLNVGKSFDISANVLELNIFESITSPFLRATIAIVDTNGIISSIRFKGTEYIDIDIDNEEFETAIPISKRFIITEVKETYKVNDSTEAFILELIEPHAFFSRSTVISKSYEGNPPQLLNAIATDTIINKNIDRKTNENEAQSHMRIIVPWLQPLQAIEWVRDRLTDEDGFPYFLYSTLQRDNLQLACLKDMLPAPGNQPWNNNRPFIFSQAHTNSEDPLTRFFSIEKLSRPNADNMLQSIQNGAIGVYYSVYDIATSTEAYAEHHDIAETLKPYLDVAGGSQTIYDPDFTITGEKLNDINSRHIYQIINSQSYGTVNNYHSERYTKGLHKTKIQNKAIRNAMLKNKMIIQMPGVGFFLQQDSTVGSCIKVQVFDSKPTQNNFDPDPIKSGNYIITDMRHVFRDTTYTVSSSITKLASEPNV